MKMSYYTTYIVEKHLVNVIVFIILPIGIKQKVDTVTSLTN